MAKENILLNPDTVAHSGEDRRAAKRIYIQMPLFVRGKSPTGEQFMELGKTLDISAVGALIACPCALTIGQSVTLTIPAPSITSSALVPAGMAPMQAKITRQQDAGDVHLIGVTFLKPIG
jgi:hypothetical protein